VIRRVKVPSSRRDVRVDIVETFRQFGDDVLLQRRLDERSHPRQGNLEAVVALENASPLGPQNLFHRQSEYFRFETTALEKLLFHSFALRGKSADDAALVRSHETRGRPHDGEHADYRDSRGGDVHPFFSFPASFPPPRTAFADGPPHFRHGVGTGCGFDAPRPLGDDAEVHAHRIGDTSSHLESDRELSPVPCGRRTYPGSHSRSVREFFIGGSRVHRQKFSFRGHPGETVAGFPADCRKLHENPRNGNALRGRAPGARFHSEAESGEPRVVKPPVPEVGRPVVHGVPPYFRKGSLDELHRFRLFPHGFFLPPAQSGALFSSISPESITGRRGNVPASPRKGF